MERVLPVVLMSLVVLLAACGGDDDRPAEPTRLPSGPTGPAPTERQRQRADDERSGTPQPDGDSRRSGDRTVASRRVEEAGAAVARYCFEDLGHKTGLRKDPPTEEEAAAKDEAVRTLVAIISQRPGLRLGGGENIQDRVTQAIVVLKRSDCDKRAAKQLERALATYPEP